MAKYLPFLVILPVLAVLTGIQWRLMDWVWGANTPALQCAYLLQTEIPHEFGDWVGTDNEVEERIRKTAGADGYIDRVYRNTRTGEAVSIWFIVGHFREVSRHTPDFCYQTQGFEQVGNVGPFPIMAPDQPTAEFTTAKFKKTVGNQDLYQRVFWAWWDPQELQEGADPADVSVAWNCPEDPRLAFSSSRALYKLYFTSMSTLDETPDQSVCIEFAEEFLPYADRAIRSSGIVMAKPDLPKDSEKVFEEMRNAGVKETEESAKQEDSDEQPAEDQPANDAA